VREGDTAIAATGADLDDPKRGEIELEAGDGVLHRFGEMRGIRAAGPQPERLGNAGPMAGDQTDLIGRHDQSGGLRWRLIVTGQLAGETLAGGEWQGRGAHPIAAFAMPAR
jgi:hypothetical protein